MNTIDKVVLSKLSQHGFELNLNIGAYQLPTTITDKFM